LLRRFELAGEVLLGKPGFLAQRRKLQRDVPGFACPFEALGKVRLFELLLQI
jgi:hypothetical protein